MGWEGENRVWIAQRLLRYEGTSDSEDRGRYLTSCMSRTPMLTLFGFSISVELIEVLMPRLYCISHPLVCHYKKVISSEISMLIDFLATLDLSLLYYNVYWKCTTNQRFSHRPFLFCTFIAPNPKISTFIFCHRSFFMRRPYLAYHVISISI